MKIEVIEAENDSKRKSYKFLPETELDYEILSEFDTFRENLVCESVDRARVEGRFGYSTTFVVLSVDHNTQQALRRKAASELYNCVTELKGLLFGQAAGNGLVVAPAPDPKL